MKQELHSVPGLFAEVFSKDKNLFLKWTQLTPLSKNEWICWVISAKKEETKQRRFKRMIEELLEGKKRPCCWAGCPHR